MLLKIKIFVFKNNYTRYDKNFEYKIVHLKKIYKFTWEHFSIGGVVYVWIVKNFFKNKKFYSEPNLFKIRKKYYERKL